MWLWFQLFIICGPVYLWSNAIPHPDRNNGYGFAAGSYFVAWLATWLLSRAIDLCRAYRWRKQR